MLLASTVIAVVLSRLSDLPEGAPSVASPILAGMALSILMMLRLFASPKWQQWAPVVAIVAGCAIAVPFGAYDWQHVIEAPWIGIPSYSWPGFDLRLWRDLLGAFAWIRYSEPGNHHQFDQRNRRDSAGGLAQAPGH